jgi:serine/threonine protein kinase
MSTFLFEHKFLVIACAYIAIGVFVVWFFREIRRINDEKAFYLESGGLDGPTFAVYKCIVVIAGVILWPFLLRNRWSETGQSKSEDGRSRARKRRQRAGMSLEDWCLGQTLLDDFVVEQVLGEGGMGKVYLVKSRTTKMRFAVKRAKGVRDGDRRNFLAELQTWIDLPEHANLVPCSFFRTVENEVLIFAEYVEGGSLRNWIDSRRLYEGGVKKALERILDTAIQFAWGLHCVHELGLVHQDVKPANVMMQKDAQVGVQGLKVRVTDYGLARARAAGGERYVPELGRSILVSSGGYTPAYCSPEQAAGRKLDRSTDVWSWGLSVMEMFQGGITWQSGRVAAEALEAFLEHNGEEEHIPAMPDGVTELLSGCFRKDPAQRWQSMEAVVQQLKGVYQAAVGAEYSRALDKAKYTGASEMNIVKRRTRQDVSLTDPRGWLERALRADGRDPAEATEIVARHSNSRRGQLVGDVAAYDEARRIYERLIKGGRKDLADGLAALCQQAAFVHGTSGDSSGALALFEQAIEIHERLVNVEGRRDLADDLARLYANKANAVMALGNNRAAMDLYDRAIEILERLFNVEGRSELANDLARLYQNKAIVLKNLGDNRAVGLHNRAIEILERLVNVEGRSELANNLAGTYMNNAVAFMAQGDNCAAVGLYNQAIEILERLVNLGGRRELVNDLAMLYHNKALAVKNLGDNQAAWDLYNQSIEIFERLVNAEGRTELANNLAAAYMNKAHTVKNLGANPAAVALYELAIKIRERLVNVEGRRELASDLAAAYMGEALVLNNIGDSQTSVFLYNRAIQILEGLVIVEGRSELAGDLTWAKACRGLASIRLGDTEGAKREVRNAEAVLRREVNQTRRLELNAALVQVRRTIERAPQLSGQDLPLTSTNRQTRY